MASSAYQAEHVAWKRDHPLVEGTLCARCGTPMFRRQPLDVGHVVDVARGGASGGRRWEHRHCNRAAGARLRNELRNANPVVSQDDSSQEW